MPARWTLTLAAEQPSAESPVTPGQLHGLAATVLESAGADHHAQHKPYSVSPLLAAERRGSAVLRLGWLQDAPRPDLTLLTGRRVRLGAQFFTVTDAAEEFTPYPALRRAPPARRVVMRFRSAAYFSRNGRWHPLPDPVLLYGGLARRWNVFAPPYASIDEPREKTLNSAVALAAHDTASCPVNLGSGSRIGFTGDAAYTLTGRHAAEAGGLFASLSLFATASGIGAQTTHGLGSVDIDLE